MTSVTPKTNKCPSMGKRKKVLDKAKREDGEGGADSYREELLELAKKPYDKSFNIVPVDEKKRPVSRSWGSDWRLEWREIEEAIKSGKATGIAIVAGPENPFKKDGKILVILDIDDPRALDRLDEERRKWFWELISKTVHWKTGPRCPKCWGKHDITCSEGSCKCSKCNIEFRLEDAPRGLAALFYADKDIVEKLGGAITKGPIELLVNNYQLLPPSLHPSGARYEWVKKFDYEKPDFGIYSLSPEELERLYEVVRQLRGEAKGAKPGAKHEAGLEAWAGAEGKPEAEAGLKPAKEPAKEPPREPAGEPVEDTTQARAARKPRVLRVLSETALLMLVELLKLVYRPGFRQFICLYISGWMAKAGIHPLSVVKLIKMLYDATGDTDPLETRLAAVVYSYKKAGIDVDQWAKEIEELTGVKPYGLWREIREEEVKGKSGLQEILEEVLGEEGALEVIRRIEEILGVASPYRDSIIEILDYEKQVYAVCNLRKLVVARAKRKENKLVYMERVAIGAPTSVEVYINPIGGLTKYKVVWETATRPKALVIGPAPIEDIVDRLVAEGLIVNRRLASDVITAVIEGFIRKGKAEIKGELESPGFYLMDGRVVAVGFDTSRPSGEKMRRALEGLDELENWFDHARDRFSLVVKWGIIAPFSFIYKQRGRWIPWLYLYGSSYTGKSTLGEIVLAIWGLDSRFKKTGASIDTPARIGHVLSQATFPVLVNEPGAAVAKEEIVEMIKNAVESAVVRGKFVRGSYTEIPALAPVIFTSNKVLPSDDALLRRFIVLRFTYGERINPEKAKEFDEKVKPRLRELEALGRFAAALIIEKPELLEMDWEKAAVAILEAAYQQAGLKTPEWVYERPKAEEDVYEDLREAIRNFLVARINEAYFKSVGRIEVVMDMDSTYKPRHKASFSERVKTVLENNLISWMMLSRDGDEVLLTTGFADELREVVGDIGGLKSIAELLGWSYQKRSFRDKEKVRNIAVISVPLERFLEFLQLEEETDQDAREQQGREGES